MVVRVPSSATTAAALVALVVFVAFGAGCDKAPTSPSDYAAFSATDLRVGTGTEVVNGSVVEVHYTGWLYDASKTDQKGAQVDTSYDGDPITFTLGTASVIDGWEQGMLGMKAGGLRRLVVPPSLGYGGVRRGLIPPNATLVFEVDLISVDEG